jgi:alpha-tubulin suppressor-like RCC1 family protein
VTSLSCGAYHTLAVMDNGALYAWGLNNYGQLGIKVS